MHTLWRMWRRSSAFAAAVVGIFFAASRAYAHEAYVLTGEEFMRGSADTNIRAFDSLKDPHNLTIFFEVGAAVLIVLIAYFLWRKSRIGSSFDDRLASAAAWGPLFMRAAIAISFFYSALTWSFLGPELPLTALPFAAVLRSALFVISVCIAFGIGTEYAAAASFIIFSMGVAVFHGYMATYANYLGEIIVLMLFGSRSASLDRSIFGSLRRFPLARQYELAIVRISYGIALIYAAINIKLLHPLLTLAVVQKYDLTRFHWLFPSDPLFVVLGAALAELAIGICIVIGFETRLAVLISLFYITLSLFFFREAVWPHCMLYGISCALLLGKETFSLDAVIFRRRAANALRIRA